MWCPCPPGGCCTATAFSIRVDLKLQVALSLIPAVHCLGAALHPASECRLEGTHTGLLGTIVLVVGQHLCVHLCRHRTCLQEALRTHQAEKPGGPGSCT